MKRQTVIALGIALVLGLLAVYFANIFLNAGERQQAADASRQQMTKVAVAAIPLDYGVQVTPDKVKFVDFPAASLPAGSFNDIQQLLPAGERRIALRPIALNEPILADKLTGPGQNASIASLLTDGKRAVAVRVNDVSGVAGFIQPNSNVDVLITRQMQGSDAQVTDVLLQNIRVLATDQDAKGADGKPVLAKTATLEVTPLEAQKLALAQQAGTLSLSLRKPGEPLNTPAVETVSLADLRYRYYGERPANWSPAATPVRRASAQRPARPRSARPAAPSGTNVEVVRGTAGNTYVVGGYGS